MSAVANIFWITKAKTPRPLFVSDPGRVIERDYAQTSRKRSRRAVLEGHQPGLGFRHGEDVVRPLWF